MTSTHYTSRASSSDGWIDRNSMSTNNIISGSSQLCHVFSDIGRSGKHNTLSYHFIKKKFADGYLVTLMARMHSGAQSKRILMFR